MNKSLSHHIYLILTIIGLILFVLLNKAEANTPIYSIDSANCVELCAICFFCLIFGWLFLSKKGVFFKGYYSDFYYGDLTQKKYNNIFYSWLMLATTVVIVYSNIHLINKQHADGPNILSALKVWEITAYWVTTFYTGWFWLNKDRGKDILKKLRDKNVETGIYLGIVVTLLFFFAVAHTLLFFGETFNNTIRDFIKENESWMSLALIVMVYTLFVTINISVIKNTKNKIVKNDFITMHRYIDRPTMAIFVILLVFAAYARYLGCLAKMENFFSGAIAFELILSSIVWSNTNTF